MICSVSTLDNILVFRVTVGNRIRFVTGLCPALCLDDKFWNEWDFKEVHTWIIFSLEMPFAELETATLCAVVGEHFESGFT